MPISLDWWIIRPKNYFQKISIEKPLNNKISNSINFGSINLEYNQFAFNVFEFLSHNTGNKLQSAFSPIFFLVTGDVSKMNFTLRHECQHQKMSVFNRRDVCQPKQPKNWHFLEWVRGHSTVNITPMHLEKSKKN